jgi:plastocyanin
MVRLPLSALAGAALLAAALPGVLAESASPDAIVGAPCASAGTGSIAIMNGFAFSPSSLAVPLGATLRWVNEAFEFHHTTTEDFLQFDGPLRLAGEVLDPPRWDSGEIEAGNEFVVRFCEAGEYAYHCELHNFMRGTVRVG